MVRKELFVRAEMEIKKLGLGYYHTLLLSSMIARKLAYPLEHTDEIIRIVTEKTVPDEYKKKKGKKLIKVSVTKELDNLEKALHECVLLPNEDLERGLIVSNVVKYYAKKILDEK